MKRFKLISLFLAFICVLYLAGCTAVEKGQSSDTVDDKIEQGESTSSPEEALSYINNGYPADLLLVVLIIIEKKGKQHVCAVQISEIFRCCARSGMRSEYIKPIHSAT